MTTDCHGMPLMATDDHGIPHGLTLLSTMITPLNRYELWLFGYHAIPHIRRAEIVYTLCTAFLNSLYHYMGLQLARAVSASFVLGTTFLSKVRTCMQRAC